MTVDVAFGINNEFGRAAIGESDDIAIGHGRGGIDIEGGFVRVGKVWPGAGVCYGRGFGQLELAAKRCRASDGELRADRAATADSDVLAD